MADLDEYTTSADYTRCRTIGHAWYEADSDWADDYNMGPGGTPVTLRCDRCGTERREVWARNGLLDYRHYAYAVGYCQPWGGNFPTKDEFRRALMAIRNTEARAERRNGIKAVKDAG